MAFVRSLEEIQPKPTLTRRHGSRFRRSKGPRARRHDHTRRSGQKDRATAAFSRRRKQRLSGTENDPETVGKPERVAGTRPTPWASRRGPFVSRRSSRALGEVCFDVQKHVMISVQRSRHRVEVASACEIRLPAHPRVGTRRGIYEAAPIAKWHSTKPVGAQKRWTAPIAVAPCRHHQCSSRADAPRAGKK